jgi:HK97 family phage prohead protease
MTMLKRLLPATISTLDDDTVEVIMSTGTIARDGHILVPHGAILDNYRANPVVLFQHNANIPVARASDIRIGANDITAKITFAPLGVSADADKVRGLVKSGIINCVSVGFDPIDGDPLDPKRPYAGKRYTKWELLECSFVSVPADVGAVVTARENEREAMTEATAAAGDTAGDTKPTRAAILTRGLYEVADLAYMLAQAGYLQSWIAMEAEFEGDGSTIPARFEAVLKELGGILIDMTAEEVAELFAGDEDGERSKGIITRAKTRAGKRLSKATIAKMEETITHHQRGIDCMRDYMNEMSRDDDDGEMAHEAAATRVANGETTPNQERAAAGLGTVITTDPPALIEVPGMVTAEQREAFAATLRAMARTGQLHSRYASVEVVAVAE